MKKILFFIFAASTLQLAQNFHSPENKKLFADHLYCGGDYLRAVLEYQSLADNIINDTIEYKIAIGLERLSRFDEAAQIFRSINLNSEFYFNSKLHFLKSKIKLGEYDLNSNQNDDSLSLTELKLMNISYLLSSKSLLDKETFLFPFNQIERTETAIYYEWKKDPPYKNPLVAGILSALVPGSGKIYTGQISEGLTALVLNGLFAFLSYNSFKNDHNIRGYIFAGAGIFFYAGNVYGSAISANRYNQKAEQEYFESIKQYLEQKNYYTYEYDFCD